MKLYTVDNNTTIRLLKDVMQPPGLPFLEKGTEIEFLHIDGMYSLCLNRNTGETLHIPASAEVEIVEI